MQSWFVSSTHLGDMWASVNWALTQSLASEKTVYLSKYAWLPEIDKSKRRHWVKADSMLTEVLSLIDAPGATVEFVDEHTHEIRYTDIFGCPYLPTKVRWSPNNSRTYAYQLDGGTYQNVKKRCKQCEKSFLWKELQCCGYKGIRLGLPLTLIEDIKILSTVEFFVGIESGLSHICHSVGVPVFMLLNRWDKDITAKVHKGKQYVLCNNTYHAVDMIKEQALKVLR